MDAYRIYGLDGRGRIRFGDYVDCPDDDRAKIEAQRLLQSYPASEVWFGRRKVACFGAADPLEA